MWLMMVSFGAVMLVATAANVLHWLMRGGKCFAWPTGPLGWMFNALTIAVLVTAILFLADVIPGGVFTFLLFGQVLTQALYSMWRRHARCGNQGTSTVA